MADEILSAKFTSREAYKQELKNSLIQKIGAAQATLIIGKTPAKEIRKRLMNPKLPKSGHNPEFSYVEHAYVSETLNLAFMLNWDLVVTKSERIGTEEALVEGYLEVRTAGTTIRKYGYGGAKKTNNYNQSWGDVFKAATSDMLKNCAARLGLGLDLYRHEEQKIDEVKVQAIAVGASKDYIEQADDADPATPELLASLTSLGLAPTSDSLTKGDVRRMIHTATAKK